MSFLLSYKIKNDICVYGVGIKYQYLGVQITPLEFLVVEKWYILFFEKIPIISHIEAVRKKIIVIMSGFPCNNDNCSTH